VQLDRQLPRLPVLFPCFFYFFFTCRGRIGRRYSVSSLLVCCVEKGLDNHRKFSRDGTQARITQLRCWNTFLYYLLVFSSNYPFSFCLYQTDLRVWHEGFIDFFLAFITPRRFFPCLRCTALHFTPFFFTRLRTPFAFPCNVLRISSVRCNFCSIALFPSIPPPQGPACEEGRGNKQ